MSNKATEDDSVRLDKWLWAARFFKTRQLARDAIEHNKVKVNGDRAKPSRIVQLGMKINVQQGWDEKTLIIQAISDKRGSAAQAATLYAETEESKKLREKQALERKIHSQATPDYGGRPDKRERRDRLRLTDEFEQEE